MGAIQWHRHYILYYHIMAAVLQGQVVLGIKILPFRKHNELKQTVSPKLVSQMSLLGYIKI